MARGSSGPRSALGPYTRERAGPEHGEAAAQARGRSAHHHRRAAGPRAGATSSCRAASAWSGCGSSWTSSGCPPSRDAAKLSGVFPLILEPRWRTRDEPLTIAYHPARQDEWFPVDPELPASRSRPRPSSRAPGPAGDARARGAALQPQGQPPGALVRGRAEVAARRARQEEGALGRPRAGGPDRQEEEEEVRRRSRCSATWARTSPSRRPRRRSTPACRAAPTASSSSSCSAESGARRCCSSGPPGCGKRTLFKRFVADQLEAEGFRRPPQPGQGAPRSGPSRASGSSPA